MATKKKPVEKTPVLDNGLTNVRFKTSYGNCYKTDDEAELETAKAKVLSDGGIVEIL